MIITLGGYPASGKGTVGKLLAEQLGYAYIGVGDLWRAEAERRNMTLNEFHTWCATHPEWDQSVEDYQRSLADQDRLILDGRLSFYCLPNSFKIYLAVDHKTAGERLLAARRAREQVATLEEAMEEIAERVRHETTKHLQQYGVDPHRLDQFDLVIDTTSKTPESVVAELLPHIR